MQDTLELEVSAEAFDSVSPGASRELKLKAAEGKLPLTGGDLGAVLLFLAHDPDTEISAAAISTIRTLSGERLMAVVAAHDSHPFLLDILARLHAAEFEIGETISLHPSVSLETLEFLALRGIQGASEAYAAVSFLDNLPTGESSDEESSDEQTADEEKEDDEEFQSKYQLAQKLGISDKIKMALTGDKEWRGILIKDSNKLVNGSVMKNPRITDSEVLLIAKMPVQNDEIIRLICHNKEWVKNYKIRKALVENSKTPLPNALRFLATLSEKDLSALSKSKNVSSVIATQARRALLNKKSK